MGVIIESSDNSEHDLVNQSTDTFVIFIMGGLLLFFFQSMIHYPKLFLISFVTYITIVILLMMLYINLVCNDDETNKKKSLVNFISLYTLCLNCLLIVVVYLNYAKTITPSMPTQSMPTRFQSDTMAMD